MSHNSLRRSCTDDCLLAVLRCSEQVTFGSGHLLSHSFSISDSIIPTQAVNVTYSSQYHPTLGESELELCK